ncbi:MAG: barstar family protein [Myxococcales bacterium]|nr:barstar family protein [Myxococcales bacterium]
MRRSDRAVEMTDVLEPVARVFLEVANSAWPRSSDACSVLVRVLPATIVDRSSFFQAMRATMPLDPPILSDYVWDALRDSLSQAVTDLGASHVLLVWPNAVVMEQRDPGEYAIATEMLDDIAATVADPQYVGGRTVCFRVLQVECAQV